MKPLEMAWLDTEKHLPDTWKGFAREAKILFYAGAHAGRELSHEAARLMTDEQYTAFDLTIDAEIHEYLATEFLETFGSKELGAPQ